MKNLRLRTKLMVILCVLFASSLTICVYVSHIPYSEYDEQINNHVTQLLTLYADRIEAKISSIEDLTLSMIGDDDLQKNLKTILRNERVDSIVVASRTSLRNKITTYLNRIPYVYYLEIATQNGDFSSNVQVTNSSISNKEVYWNTALSASGKCVWLVNDDMSGDLLALREIREIENRSMNTLGVIMLRVNLNSVISEASQILSSIDLPLEVGIVIDNRMVYCSNNNIAESFYENNYKLDGLDETKKEYFVTWYSPGREWSYIVSIDYSKIKESISTATLISSIIMLICLSIVMIICLLLVNSIVKNFSILADKLDDYQKSGLPSSSKPIYIYPYKHSTEITELYERFDQIISDHYHMTQEIYVKQILIKDAQIKQLKQQINPHFMFNTLETIKVLSVYNQNKKATMMIDALSTLLRISLKEQRNLVTFEEDLNFAMCYLQIQKIRYEERLKIITDIDKQALSVQIPYITLQLILENCIIHALEEMIETCIIQIRAKIDGDMICVSIEDNGPGIALEIQKKLFIERPQQYGGTDSKDTGIGLNNINQRLMLLLSERSKLHIDSSDTGTKVYFYLPVKLQNNS